MLYIYNVSTINVSRANTLQSSDVPSRETSTCILYVNRLEMYSYLFLFWKIFICKVNILSGDIYQRYLEINFYVIQVTDVCF